MKIHNTNLSPFDAADQPGRKQASRGTQNTGGDDVHLSELVRSLRSMAATPERQERLEQIARSYANGTYQMDTDATAGRIIDDSLNTRTY